MEVQGVPPGAPLRLATPTWVPGAYGFMRYARDLSDVRATDERGAELKVTRDGWSGFRVAAAPSDRVRVTYRAFAYDPAWGELSGLVDHEHAVLLGTRYLFAPELGGPCRVHYELPPGWALHHPGGARQLDERTFEYASYPVLLDTPVVAGSFTVKTRRAHGADFHHVFVDRAVGFETELDGFVDAVMRTADACHDLFGSFPFDRYSFIFTFNPTAGWGLEHAHGTMIGLSGLSLVDPADRGRAMRVCAHELFHAWNVCRLKPAALARADLVGGSYTDDLWLAEGVTRYMEFVLCARAGFISGEDFFANVVNYYRHLTAMPAYARTSAVDSSRATFLNHTKYPGSINNTVDYYDLGMLVAFDLDAALRLQAPAGSLDAELRAFYEAFGARPGGYTHEEVVRFFGERSPKIGELLAREVEGRGALSVPEWLQALGFEVHTGKVRYLGLVLKDNAGPELANVLDDSPAAQSGIAPGDELLLLDGHPFHLKALRWLIDHRGEVQVRARRGHRTLDLTLPVGERTDITGLTWNGTEAQAERVRAWLGRTDFAPAAGQAIPLTAYDNFHGIQTVM
jgi:predicted metalloprotease with PDZ domain